MRIRTFGLALGLPLLTAAALAQTTTITTTTVTHNRPARTTAASVIHVTVNQKPIAFRGPGPVMVGGSSVLVPVRGARVAWEPSTQTVVITAAPAGAADTVEETTETSETTTTTTTK